MSMEEFMKQQYITLRDEIRASKARIFLIMILGTLFVPAAGYAAIATSAAFAAASMPFVVLVLMLAFVMEQNSIIRAGTYLKNHVEPHIEGVTTWEHWLESNRALRDTDRYFFGSFLLVFFLFYAVGAGSAVEAMIKEWPQHVYYVAGTYVIGGIWFVIVLMRHWHACTATD